MKDTKFFIDKSNKLIGELEQLKFDSTSDWFDNGDITKSNDAIKNNDKLIGEVEFQIKLMFSEFDNGQLFLNKMKSFHHSPYFGGYEPIRNYLVDTLKTFIAYLEEYRVKPISVDIN